MQSSGSAVAAPAAQSENSAPAGSTDLGDFDCLAETSAPLVAPPVSRSALSLAVSPALLDQTPEQLAPMH